MIYIDQGGMDVGVFVVFSAMASCLQVREQPSNLVGGSSLEMWSAIRMSNDDWLLLLYSA